MINIMVNFHAGKFWLLEYLTVVINNHLLYMFQMKTIFLFKKIFFRLGIIGQIFLTPNMPASHLIIFYLTLFSSCIIYGLSKYSNSGKM